MIAQDGRPISTPPRPNRSHRYAPRTHRGDGSNGHSRAKCSYWNTLLMGLIVFTAANLITYYGRNPQVIAQDTTADTTAAPTQETNISDDDEDMHVAARLAATRVVNDIMRKDRRKSYSEATVREALDRAEDAAHNVLRAERRSAEGHKSRSGLRTGSTSVAARRRDDQGPLSLPLDNGGKSEADGHFVSPNEIVLPPTVPLGRTKPTQLLHRGHITGENKNAITFPCSLTEFQDEEETTNRLSNKIATRSPRTDSHVTTTSVCMIGVTYKEASRVIDVSRPIRVCSFYQECTHMMYHKKEVFVPKRGRKPREYLHPSFAGFIELLHVPREDGSLRRIDDVMGKREKGPAGSLTRDPRARIYYIVSFGGSGSNMLSNWLRERGEDMVEKVLEFNNPEPANELLAMEASQGASLAASSRGGTREPPGDVFAEGVLNADGQEVPELDKYRVVLIFKDPAEALMGLYSYEYCKDLRGADCGGDAGVEFPSLERYADEDGDRLHLESFYDNYCSPQGSEDYNAVRGTAETERGRNFPIICVNYHKIWDNGPALALALGFPPEEASKLPIREETVRNDKTSRERGGEPYTLSLREKLRQKHSSLSKKIFEAPAVAIV